MSTRIGAAVASCVRGLTPLALASLSAVLLVLLVLPAIASAAPVGVSTVTVSKQTVDGKDYIVSETTIAPGGSTGWHTHPGTDYAVVTAGSLTDYAGNCGQDGVYNVGDAFTHHTGAVHLVRNLGTTPVVFEATFIDPAGAPTIASAPNPGCDFS